jgi:hypothetical protein
MAVELSLFDLNCRNKSSRTSRPVHKRNFRVYYRGGKPSVCRHFLPLMPFQNALQVIVSINLHLYRYKPEIKKNIKIISSFKTEVFYLSVFFCKSVIFIVFERNITKSKGHEISCSKHKFCLVKISNATYNCVLKNKFSV